MECRVSLGGYCLAMQDATVEIVGGYKLQQIDTTGKYRVVKEDDSAYADLPKDIDGGWELHQATEACACAALNPKP